MSSGLLAKPRNVGIGAMAAPLLIVAMMVLFGGVSEPRSTVADVQPPPDPEQIIRASMTDLTEAQRRAIEFRKSIQAPGETDSPFPPAVEVQLEIPDFVDSDGPGEDLPVIAEPEFVVTGVMTSKAGNIVLINGKARRAGDEIDGGWVIEAIDAKTKQVILTHPERESMTLRLNR